MLCGAYPLRPLLSLRVRLSALSDALSFALEHLLHTLYHLWVGLVVGRLHVCGAIGVCYPHRICCRQRLSCQSAGATYGFAARAAEENTQSLSRGCRAENIEEAGAHDTNSNRQARRAGRKCRSGTVPSAPPTAAMIVFPSQWHFILHVVTISTAKL